MSIDSKSGDVIIDMSIDSKSGDVIIETGITSAVQSLVIGSIFIDGAQKNDLLLNSIGNLFTPGSHSTITATVGTHTAQTAVGAALPLVFVCMLLMASKMVTSGYIKQSEANQQALINISDDNKHQRP